MILKKKKENKLKRIEILYLTDDEKQEMRDSLMLKSADEKKESNIDQEIADSMNQSFTIIRFIKNGQQWTDTEKLINMIGFMKKLDKAGKKKEKHLFIEDKEHTDLLALIQLREPRLSPQGQVLDGGFVVGGNPSEKYAEFYCTIKDAVDVELKDKKWVEAG